MRGKTEALLAVAFAVLLIAGYANGNFSRVFGSSPHMAQQATSRALGRLTGSETEFDAAADDVTTTAQGAGDSVTWKKLSAAKARGGAKGISVDYGAVRALDGKDVTITGYMFPLQGAEKQDHFILSAWPPSCPYCLPGGPGEMIEVHAAKPLGFTYAPVTVRGQLHLQVGDGVFYAMSEATAKP